MESRLFWQTYSSLANKLKKRFLHKPNHAEGARDFEELKRLVRREGLPNYAAFCCLAAARCHQALGDAQAEAAQHAEAASLYAVAERELQKFVFSVDGSTVGFEENYVEALDCYQLAIQQYLKLGNAVMAVELCIELAGLVKLLSKYDEAISHYQTAISLQTHYGIGLLQRVNSYDAILDCLYRQRSWLRAIHLLEELINVLTVERAKQLPGATVYGNDIFACKILEAETNRLLLMLIEDYSKDDLYRELARLTGDSYLDPTFAASVDSIGKDLLDPLQLRASAGQASSSLKRTPSSPIGSASVLNKTLFLSEHVADMLEALIEASLVCNIEMMVALEATISSFLSPAQCALVGILIKSRQKLL